MTEYLDMINIKAFTGDSIEFEETPNINIICKTGFQGPKGDTEFVGNIDAGTPSTNYGGFDVIDGGTP
jgi:hypothetical protein